MPVWSRQCLQGFAAADPVGVMTPSNMALAHYPLAPEQVEELKSAALAMVVAQLALIRRGTDGERCPFCGESQRAVHAETCPIIRVLAAIVQLDHPGAEGNALAPMDMTDEDLAAMEDIVADRHAEADALARLRDEVTKMPPAVSPRGR